MGASEYELLSLLFSTLAAFLYLCDVLSVCVGDWAWLSLFDVYFSFMKSKSTLLLAKIAVPMVRSFFSVYVVALLGHEKFNCCVCVRGYSAARI